MKQEKFIEITGDAIMKMLNEYMSLVANNSNPIVRPEERMFCPICGHDQQTGKPEEYRPDFRDMVIEEIQSKISQS